jgi:hypothetical protein
MEAISVEISGNELGEFVGDGPAFKKCPAPGKRKSIGETLVPVLMPLQPAPNTPSAASIASHGYFQFNLTSRV